MAPDAIEKALKVIKDAADEAANIIKNAGGGIENLNNVTDATAQPGVRNDKTSTRRRRRGAPRTPAADNDDEKPLDKDVGIKEGTHHFEPPTAAPRTPAADNDDEKPVDTDVGIKEGTDRLKPRTAAAKDATDNRGLTAAEIAMADPKFDDLSMNGGGHNTCSYNHHAWYTKERFKVGTEGCAGVSECQFAGWDAAEAFCSSKKTCTAILLKPAETPASHCDGELGCFVPRKGKLGLDLDWKEAGGTTFVKHDCPGQKSKM